MGVDVEAVQPSRACFLQGFQDGPGCPCALRLGCGDVEGVTGAALATVGNDTAPSALAEAGQALESLGYDWREIKPVLDRLPAEEQQVGNLVRLALKELSRRA